MTLCGAEQEDFVSRLDEVAGPPEECIPYVGGKVVDYVLRKGQGREEAVSAYTTSDVEAEAEDSSRRGDVVDDWVGVRLWSPNAL